MRMRKTAVLTAAMLLLTGTAALTGCGSSYEAVEADLSGVGTTSFIMTLYPDVAPETCKNFINLVSDHFYDGITFHRVVADFMAQGGDPDGTGAGGSQQTIKGEFSSNGFNNTLSHTRGVVSMARTNDPDSASSQFFICYSDSDTFLDGNYAAFGKVTEGMEVVDNFLDAERTYNSGGELAVPVNPIVMDTVVMIEKDSDGNPRVLVNMRDFPIAKTASADSNADAG